LVIKVNPKYSPISKADSRYFIVTGGRGSGKSFSINLMLCLLTYEKGHVILFSRYTLTSAYVSIIPEFIEKLELLNIFDHFQITKDEIQNKISGSKIIFKGIKTSSGDQTANLKSLQGVTTFVLDEAEELTSEDTFDKIDLSVRSQSQTNRIILILNPTTKEHWIYQRFFQDKGIQEGFNVSKDDVTYIHTTYLDNIQNLSESYLSQIDNIKVRRPNKYKHQILGGWLDKAEGVIFTNWTIGEFKKVGVSVFGQDYFCFITYLCYLAYMINKQTNKMETMKPLFTDIELKEIIHDIDIAYIDMMDSEVHRQEVNWFVHDLENKSSVRKYNSPSFRS
jgi:phage terminase large subunit